MIQQSSLLRFQEIASSGSIRAAAGRLFITPSALSRELQRLEEDLGTTLFERKARGMVLTAAGKIYLGHVRDALNNIERMRSELDALQNLHRGHVSLLSVEGCQRQLRTDTVWPGIGNSLLIHRLARESLPCGPRRRRA